MPVLDRAEYEIVPEVQRELLKHPGKWVALTRTEIIAIGNSREEVRLEAQRRGREDAGFYRVPEGTRSYFF